MKTIVFAMLRSVVWQNGTDVSETSPDSAFGLPSILKLKISGLYEIARRSLSVLTITFRSSLSIFLRHLPPCLSISLILRLFTSFCLHNFCIAAYSPLSKQLFALRTSYESARGPG
jgi:hypothetical protein